MVKNDEQRPLSEAENIRRKHRVVVKGLRELSPKQYEELMKRVALRIEGG